MPPDSGALVAEESTRANVGWEPESPFLNDVPAPSGSATAAAAAVSRAFAPAYENESPFVSEYAGEAGTLGPQAEQFASVVGELHDPEFTEALEDLVNEAAAVAEDRFSSEVGDPGRQRLDAERAVQEYLAPLGRATEAMLDRIAAGLEGKDISQLSETEVDTLLEQFARRSRNCLPLSRIFSGAFSRKQRRRSRAYPRSRRRSASSSRTTSCSTS